MMADDGQAGKAGDYFGQAVAVRGGHCIVFKIFRTPRGNVIYVSI